MGDLRVAVAVVGAGLTGTATAWALARRGISVALLEAYTIGHANGSSHGSSRIVRRAYPDPFYLRLTGQANEAWARASEDTGVPLVRWTGAVDHGATRDPAGLAERFTAEGLACSLLTAGEAAERWPGMRFAGPVLYHPESGYLNADAAVHAFARRAAGLGTTVLENTRVTAITPVPSGALVRTGDGPAVAADTVVVAAGPWLPELGAVVPAPLPPLTVTQQQVFHFPFRDPSTAWPTSIHMGEVQVYALPSGSDGGARPAYKVAQHDGGVPTTATTRDRRIDPASRDLIVRYVRDFLPGLEPEPVAAASCLYTSTPDEDFVLDRVGPVVLASPCSGHGAKFAAIIGEMTAALALGDAAPEPRFSLGRF
ncbi:FAD-dependent oxidoreductase [Actinoplanes utahensis]|uniref:Sarcosine oxidase n=1 Tax=Actinoplanes utahensis TaxID=1869 RepID=A0A0A6UUA4_ACTUT|nr:FAD-dependent oxidoreductase [Actinoplanes utahensis]KHD78044.1 sarcosine oxidase [Actinoplanes utahensis]